MPVCSCGNNKLRSACCALKISSKPWSGVAKKVTIAVAVAQAREFAQQNNWQATLTILKSVDKHVGFHPESTYLKALFAFHQGNAAVAVSLFEKVSPFFGSNISFVINYASALGKAGAQQDAIHLLKVNTPLIEKNEKALVFAFERAMQAYCYDFALNTATRLLQLNKSVKRYWLSAIRCNHLCDKDTAALELIDSGLQLFRNDEDLLFEKASIFETQNKLKDSWQIIEDALGRESVSNGLRVLAAKVSRRQNKTMHAKQYLSSVDMASLANEKLLARAYYEEKIALSKAEGNPQQTLLFAQEMHLHQQSIPDHQWHKIATQQAEMARASNQLLALLPLVQNNTKANNIFIVGFPRSGSTLLEKYIVASFDIIGNSESNVVPDIIEQIEQKEKQPWWHLTNSVLQTHCAEIQPLATRYDHTNTDAVNVDKNLFNQRNIALIKTLSPESIVLRCIRDPLAIVMSCYLTNFSHVAPWQHTLLGIARYLALLDTCWDVQVNQYSDRILSLKYEQIVNQQGLTQELTAMLDKTVAANRRNKEEYERHFSEFRSRTASYAQVTQGISLDRNTQYLPYIPMLPKDVKDIIASLQEKWGYPVTVA